MENKHKRNQSIGQVQPSIRALGHGRRPSYVPPPISPGNYSSPISPTARGPPIFPLPPQQPTHSAHPIPVLDPIPPMPHQQPQSPSNPGQSHSQPAAEPEQTQPPLPDQAIIAPIEEHHIQPLRRINALLLPIHYPDTFYSKILSPDPNAPSTPRFSRVILWGSPSLPSSQKVIGSLICRLDPTLHPSSTPTNPLPVPDTYEIYIQSLTLLSPYRSKGLASKVLTQIIQAATQQTGVKIESLYAHVWTSNEEALQWYIARGFRKEDGVLHGYYRRLNPDTAWILRRPLVVSDHLASLNQDPNQAWKFPTQTSVPPPPPPVSSPVSRPPPQSARSFQHAGPEREWNDLPEEVLLKPPSGTTSRDRSVESSRSSSRSGVVDKDAPGQGLKGKKKRVYPAAAFGA